MLAAWTKFLIELFYLIMSTKTVCIFLLYIFEFALMFKELE